MNSQDCNKICPNRNNAAFPELSNSCPNGFMIELDANTLRDPATGVELARPLCGSQLLSGEDVPSISVEDYMNTLLPMSALRKLYDHGLLPHQAD